MKNQYTNAVTEIWKQLARIERKLDDMAERLQAVGLGSVARLSERVGLDMGPIPAGPPGPGGREPCGHWRVKITTGGPFCEICGQPLPANT